jgi:hypothetical protein
MDTYRLNRSPVYLLHRVQQCAEEVFRQSTTSGLTPRQLAVLMTVAENEGVNQLEISALTGIDRTTAARWCGVWHGGGSCSAGAAGRIPAPMS